MRVVAIERITYASRPYQPGEEFEIEDIYGRLFEAHGKVRKANSKQTLETSSIKAETPEEHKTVAETPASPRGRYKRRDMRSES